MKCKECPYYKDNTCTKANLFELEDEECLLKNIAAILWDIWYELSLQNEDKGEGESWKL